MEQKVREFILDLVKDTDISEASITESTHLRDDLALSSFDLATLTVMIEDEYDVDIFEDKLVFTFGEIMDILVAKV